MNALKVPSLRFPEFSGEWVSKLLGDVASFSKGKGIAKNEIDEFGSIECIRYGELYTHYGEVITEVKSKTNTNVSDLVLSIPNDVIIPASGETQLDIATAACVMRGGIALGGDLNIIRTEIFGVFLAYYLNSAKKREIAKLAQGNSVVHLYSSQLKTLLITTPSLPEKTKIAAFLSAVDSKIDQLSQKKALLEQYKKGVMQQIFSQQIRFKADYGSDYPEWEEKRLGDLVATLTSGLSVDQVNYKTMYPVTRIETISDRTINFEKVGYIVPENDVSDYRLEIGDILFSNINSLSHIGKVVYFDSEEALYHGMNLLRIVFRKADSCSKYMFYQLSSEKLKLSFESRANKAVNQASINQSELKKTLLVVPCLEEQTKIANFLFVIDSKIEQVAQQLEAAKQFKKGLLQQMFV